jgi:hypothetical protein
VTAGNTDYVDGKVPFFVMKGELEALYKQLLQHDLNLFVARNAFCIRLAFNIVKIAAEPPRPIDDLHGVQSIRKGNEIVHISIAAPIAPAAETRVLSW